MERTIVGRSSESHDDRRRQRNRELYRQRRDKEILQQKQARVAGQREYHRQRKAQMTPEQHDSLLQRRESGYHWRKVCIE